MIRLRNVKNESIHYFIVKNEGYTVGRKDCSIKIEGDQSISRKHASLFVTHPIEHVGHPNKLPQLELKDSSKYGTIVNGTKVPIGGSKVLQIGDRVIFGAAKSNSWRVEYVPFIVACSGLASKEKLGLKRILSILGGHMLSEWTKECTLLIMKEVHVTAKVIGALVTCRPIVTPAFISDYQKALLESNPSFPDASNYLPPVVERAINQDSSLFQTKEERRTLLAGRTFVFLSEKQHKRLHSVIDLAGGKVVLYSEIVNNPALLMNPSTCVLQSEAADNTQSPASVSHDIEKILNRNKLRMIAEAELGLAVLMVSTRIYCNSTVAKEGVKLVSCIKDSQFVGVTNQKILAEDTPMSEVTQISQKSIRCKREPSITMKTSANLDKSTVPSTSTRLVKQLSTSDAAENIVASEFASSNEAETEISNKLPTVQKSSSDGGKGVKRSAPLDTSTTAKPPESLRNEHCTKKIKLEQVESFSDTVKEEPGEMGQNDTEDTVPPVHNGAVKVKDEIAKADNAPAPTLIVDDSQSQVGDSQDSQSQWRRKKRRRQLSEDEDAVSAHEVKAKTINEGKITVGQTGPSQQLPSLPGFMSKGHLPESAKSEEVPTYEPTLPSKCALIKSVSLVISVKSSANEAGKNIDAYQHVKNFKNFRKSAYAGQSILPRIIGGSDLTVHHNMPSQGSQDMFMLDEQRSSDINKAEALADELFFYEPKTKSMGRRR